MGEILTSGSVLLGRNESVVTKLQKDNILLVDGKEICQW